MESTWHMHMAGPAPSMKTHGVFTVCEKPGQDGPACDTILAILWGREVKPALKSDEVLPGQDSPGVWVGL